MALESGDSEFSSLSQVFDRATSSRQHAEQINKKNQLVQSFQKRLKTYEPMLLSLQRLLVWDDLTYSSVFIVVLHALFIYVFSRCNHIIGFTSSVTLLVVWIDMWKEKIWPEIRALTPSSDSEWGELHPRLLTLREMCELLADFVLYFQDFSESAMRMREENPTKFVISASFCCVVAATIGKFIPGVVLFYFFFSALVFWPCIWHHRLLEKTYTVVEPYMMGLQYTLKQRPGETYQVSDGAKSSELSTPDEDFISGFIAPMNDNTVAVLAKALTEGSELSEADEGILADKLPSFSKFGNMSKLDAFVDGNASTAKLPTSEDFDESSDDEQIGFVPSSTAPSTHRFVEQSDQLLTAEGNQVLNDIMKEVSATAVSSFGKIVQQGLASGLAPINPVNNTIGQNQSTEARRRRSDSSSPSSEFEILDSAMLE